VGFWKKGKYQPAQTGERGWPHPPRAEIEGSAVGDVHRDFETETQVSERRGGPLHGESPVVGIRDDCRLVTAFGSNQPALL
jgi:hypothetical protein